MLLEATRSEAAEALPLIRELLAVVPGTCSWLLPVRDSHGAIVDYLTAATSSQSVDVAGRGESQRVGIPLSQRYPGLVGGDLWQAYADVLESGVSWYSSGFVYEELSHRVPTRSEYDLAVHRIRGGILVCWQRVDEYQRRLDKTELLGNLGWADYDLATGHSEWSGGMYRIFARDPRLGPLSRLEQAALVIDDDRLLAEGAWHALDDAGHTDLVFRVHIGQSVRHLRVFAELVRDGHGDPVKIYAVVQDVTATVASGTALERAAIELRRQQLSLLAEHRVASRLQQIILPLPDDPFDLQGLRVLVQYLPAELSSRVGGDWYMATTDTTNAPICGIGDVAGHGLPAATAMAELRYALNAWITIGVNDPADLMSHLNEHCLRLGTTATAMISRFDAAARTLTWAQAGHPAPLHAREGQTAELERPHGILLGVTPGIRYTTCSFTLRRGDLVFMYTDGLIEHRSEDPSARLRGVQTALARLSEHPDDQPLAQLREILRFANQNDDTCLVALRLL